MVSLECLLKDPDIVTHLSQLMKYEGHITLPNDGKLPTLSNIYNHFRDNLGIEVDLQTIGKIYADSFAQHLDNHGFTSQRDIDKMTSATIEKIVQKKQAEIRRGEIGKDNAVVSAIKHLAALVQPDEKTDPTIQKIFQERLKKVLRNKLDIKGKLFDKQSTDELLREVLKTDQENPYEVGDPATGHKYLLGYIADANSLWHDMQREVDSVANDMQAQGSYGADQFRAYADAIKNASYDLFFSHRETQQVIMDILKDAGFSRVMTVNGKDRLVMDWKKVLNNDLNFPVAMDRILEGRGFSDAERAKLVPYFEKEYNQLRDSKITSNLGLDNTVKEKNDVQRLAQMARMGIFDSTEKKLIYDMIGVDSLTSQEMQEITNTIKTFNQAMDLLPELQYSPVFADSITRHVRNIVEMAQEKRSNALMAVRKAAMYMQWSSSALLANVGNMVENISSGFSGDISHLLTSVVTNPAAIPRMFKSFANTFVDVVKGGAREGKEQLNIYDKSVSVEDRTSQEELKSTSGKTIWGGLNIMQRAFLSGMDSAVKASIFGTIESEIYRRVLEAQGLDKDEAHLVMNETYFGNREQLEKVAKMGEEFLTAAGMNTAKGKWKRIAAQMSVANLVTGDGSYMSQMLQQMEAAGKIHQGAAGNIQINNDLIETIRHAAYNVAGRELGHKQDVYLGGVFDRPVAWAKSHADQARKTGNYKLMAREEAKALATYSMFKFRSGGLRWLFLNAYKGSYAPALTTLFIDMAMGGQHKLLGTKNLAEGLNQVFGSQAQGKETYEKTLKAFGDDLEKAYAVRARLGRSFIQPLVGYAMWKMVLGPAFNKMMSYVCNTGTAACMQDKVLTIKQNKWDAFITKMAPIAFQNYMLSMVTNNGFGQYSPAENIESSVEKFFLQDPGESLGVYLGANFNDDPIFGPVKKMGEYFLKGKEDKALTEMGTFLGHSINIGGPLKTFDIDRRYYRSYEGMTAKSDHGQWSNVKEKLPNNAHTESGEVIDAIMKEQMTEDLFKIYNKNVHKTKQ